MDLQEREYADSTIYSALRVLKTILRKHAVQNENYEEMIHHCYLTVHRLESKVLLEDESACIKEYLLKKNDTYALGILLCRSTGIRIGELCGLKWEDIHLDTGIFEIKRTVSRIQMIITGKDFQKQCYISERQNRFHRSERYRFQIFWKTV